MEELDRLKEVEQQEDGSCRRLLEVENTGRNERRGRRKLSAVAESKKAWEELRALWLFSHRFPSASRF